MKILFVVTGYRPEFFGSAEAYLQNLAGELHRRGHDVAVATFDERHERGRQAQGVKVHRLGFTMEVRPPAFFALRFYPELYDKALALLERERPDVVHVTNSSLVMPFAFAAMRLDIPVVGTHVDFSWFCREGHLLQKDGTPCAGLPDAPCIACDSDLTDEQSRLVESLRNRMYSLLARSFAYHHCPSPLFGRHLRRLGAAAPNVGVFPYGVPDDLPERQLAGTGSAVLRLGFIGHWNRINGIEVLLDAIRLFGENAPVELNLYGELDIWSDGAYGMEQALKAGDLPGVVVRGRFSPGLVADIHREIDVLVAPAIWPENSPASILEALALGTPVVCADGEGMTNLIVDGENGLIFRRGDPQDLARRITELLENPELLAEVTRGARPLRTVGQDVDLFTEVYRAALHDKPVPSLDELARFVQSFRIADEVYAAGVTVRMVRRKSREMADRGWKKIAIFGAGRHTLKLLGNCEMPGIELVAILDQNPDAVGGEILGIPVRPLEKAPELGIDAVLVSSDCYEQNMLKQAAFLREYGIGVTGFFGEETSRS
jgi:glycosyltransferase involved in cell wall biosynthesis